MIEPLRDDPSVQAAAEWVIRALVREGLPVLWGGRAALDAQGEYTGSYDVDILIGTDFRGARRVLDAYADRGDLDLVMGTPGVMQYLVRNRPVDLLDLPAVHPRLYRVLKERACVEIDMGTAGRVGAVTREGYFVLAVLVGVRGFAREKEDPMWKVREAWAFFGSRTDRVAIEGMLSDLGAPGSLEQALREPEGQRVRP